MLHMRRVAAHYGGSYSHEQIGRTAEGGPLYGHVLRGYNAVDCLRKRKGHHELNLIEGRADAIRRDVAALSPGIDTPPASLQIKPSDGTQQGGYWANDGSGRRTQDQFLGIDLYGGRSPG